MMQRDSTKRLRQSCQPSMGQKLRWRFWECKKAKKWRSKIHNFVIITITLIAVHYFFFSIFDWMADDWIIEYLPIDVAIFTVSSIWLTLFGIANADWLTGYEDEEDDEWDI